MFSLYWEHYISITSPEIFSCVIVMNTVEKNSLNINDLQFRNKQLKYQYTLRVITIMFLCKGFCCLKNLFSEKICNNAHTFVVIFNVSDHFHH
jgi:hypothetical protein